MKKIAIIGAGVAGLTAAYLLSKKYEVKIFEKNNYFGGHTNTVLATTKDNSTYVDTGFIVLNNKTYPTFHSLLKKLDVPVRNTDMSFGYYDQGTKFSYSGKSLNSLFSSRSNLLSLDFYKFLLEIMRFSKQAKKDLALKSDFDLNLAAYVEKHNFSSDLVEKYLLPISAAIWSTDTKRLLEFPVETLLNFFFNHGLLQVLDRPQWQTVVGGSKSYVEKIISILGDSAIISSPVQSVVRKDSHVEVTTNETENFDAVIFATHADQVLDILKTPSQEEEALFKVWKYNKNPTTLHTDLRLMPENKNAYASWNFIKLNYSDRLIVTYDMNNLMGLNTSETFLVSLNSSDLITENKKIAEFNYEHPLYTLESLASQKKLPEINGKDRIWYCGSYFGFGFHEDAVKSAFKVAKDFSCYL